MWGGQQAVPLGGSGGGAPAGSRGPWSGSASLKQKALYIHSSGPINPILDRPQTPSQKTHQICINPRNTLWQKCGGHVHPSPPRGDAPVVTESMTSYTNSQKEIWYYYLQCCFTDKQTRHRWKRNLLGHGRPQAWATGHLPSPGKVEKCYRVEKTPSPKSIFNSRDAAFLRRKTVNGVQHRLFHMCIL